MKILLTKKFRSRQTIQCLYKVCLHPRSYNKFIIFLGENICKSGSNHHPPLEMNF